MVTMSKWYESDNRKINEKEYYQLSRLLSMSDILFWERKKERKGEYLILSTDFALINENELKNHDVSALIV